VEAITVDQVTGKIFIVDAASFCGFPCDVSLLRFPPKAAGNTAPFARSGSLLPAVQLASNSTGQSVIEARSISATTAAEFGVDTIVKQFANGAQPDFTYDISYFDVSGVADDPTTKTYLVTSGTGIYRLEENTVTSGISPLVLKPAPVSIITSDTCGRQLALGYLRNIYVTHSTSGNCPADAVYVYTHDSSGNVAPLRVLSGLGTKLSEPYGIYEGK
jgi:hypothetical protein